MISFIIIGKNIERTINICINSIFTEMSRLNCNDYEILYVDSKSDDKTLKILRRFPRVRKFQITGECNAAIARNIGANEAIGDSLFFLDGDMELCVDFIPEIFDENFRIKYDFVSGDLLNHFYDFNGNDLNIISPYFNGNKIEKDRVEYTTGGFFVIKKQLWMEAKGMRSCFRRSQDLDLGLRLSKLGYPLIRKKQLMAIHHTVSYYNINRFFKMLFQGDYSYSGLLFRKNFFNLFTWKLFLRIQPTALILIATMVILSISNPYMVSLYIASILGRAVLKRERQNKSMLFHFFCFLVLDFIFLVSFLFFYPKRKKIKYIQIED